MDDKKYKLIVIIYIYIFHFIGIKTVNITCYHIPTTYIQLAGSTDTEQLLPSMI